MTLDETIKEVISRTGIPEELLSSCDTPEGVIARAKDLLEYKDRCRSEHPEQYQGETRDQFAAWFKAQIGNEEQPPESKSISELEQLEQTISQDQKLYPDFHDAGESFLGDDRSAKEKFDEWFHSQVDFDPRKGRGGWRRII